MERIDEIKEKYWDVFQVRYILQKYKRENNCQINDQNKQKQCMICMWIDLKSQYLCEKKQYGKVNEKYHTHAIIQYAYNQSNYKTNYI